MGARRFYYFVPMTNAELNYAAMAASIEKRVSVKFSKEVYLNEFDLDGSPMPVQQVNYSDGLTRLVESSMKEGKGVEIECNSTDLLMVCLFGSPHEKQLTEIAVSRRILSRLGAQKFHNFEAALVKVASDVGAAFLVTVDDSPDDFFGRIVAIDETWMFDLGDSYWTDQPVSVVLVNDESALPVMRNLQATGRTVAGFREYREKLRA